MTLLIMFLLFGQPEFQKENIVNFACQEIVAVYSKELKEFSKEVREDICLKIDSSKIPWAQPLNQDKLDLVECRTDGSNDCVLEIVRISSGPENHWTISYRLIIQGCPYLYHGGIDIGKAEESFITYNVTKGHTIE